LEDMDSFSDAITQKQARSSPRFPSVSRPSFVRL
jgi:hypothetical protein